MIENAIDCVEFKIKNKMEQYDISKVGEKAKFIKSAIEIVNELNTNSEKEVYLDLIKKLTGVSVDTLKKDVVNNKNYGKNNERNLIYTEDAEIKAIKFVLASLCYKKEYANFEFDLSKYLINSTYLKLYNVLKDYSKRGDKFLISNLYDIFDVDNEPNIKDIIDYNFELISNPIKYYEECVWKIRETYLKEKIKNLSEESVKLENINAKMDILKQIKELQNKLRNKILED